MSWTLQQAVDRIVAEGVDEDEVTPIANQRYAELIVRSGYLRKTVTIGTTVADQAQYDLADSITKVRNVYIVDTDDEITRYPDRIGEDEMLAIRAEEASGSYVYAQYWDADGQLQIDLEPAPEDSGYTIKAACECRPDELDLADTLAIPDEHVQGFLDGIRATIYAEEDEQLGEASAWLQSFEATVEKLRRYVNARVVGDAAIQIPMRGIQFRG